jgi:hypothetical protein
VRSGEKVPAWALHRRAARRSNAPRAARRAKCGTSVVVRRIRERGMRRTDAVRREATDAFDTGPPVSSVTDARTPRARAHLPPAAARACSPWRAPPPPRRCCPAARVAPNAGVARRQPAPVLARTATRRTGDARAPPQPARRRDTTARRSAGGARPRRRAHGTPRARGRGGTARETAWRAAGERVRAARRVALAGRSLAEPRRAEGLPLACATALTRAARARCRRPPPRTAPSTRRPP